jgi:uncharacterized protein
MLEGLKFEWDADKEILNIKKHGVSFTQAVTTFNDPDGIDLEDIAHSDSEKRRFWIGRTSDNRVVTVRYTVRDDIIRIIGAAIWRNFREKYNEKAKTQ